MAKRAKAELPSTAASARRTEQILVSGGFDNPGYNRAERIVDSARRLLLAHHISPSEYDAAQKFVHCSETVPGGLHCPLASTVPGTGPPGPREPGMQALKAAQALREARDLLGDLDFRLCEIVLVEGRGITGAARRLFQQRASASDISHIGRRLREALSQLAGLWFPTRRRFHVFRGRDAKPVIGEAGTIPAEAIATAHASRHGVR